MIRLFFCFCLSYTYYIIGKRPNCQQNNPENMKKITLFLLCSLFVLVSCSKNIEKCVFFDFKDESIKNYAKNLSGNEIYAHIRCNF